VRFTLVNAYPGQCPGQYSLKPGGSAVHDLSPHAEHESLRASRPVLPPPPTLVCCRVDVRFTLFNASNLASHQEAVQYMIHCQTLRTMCLICAQTLPFLQG
jgi:hypothetical protein